MSRTLHIGRGLELPLETAVVQRYGFLGTVGSGKSSTAQVLAEEFLAHHVQIVAIDPTGTWWGLRAKQANAGESSGLPIAVIGGKNGDLPLDPDRGPEYARWVVEKLPSVIFDLKGQRPGKRERFVEAFMRELYRLKGEARERTPLHIFFEEAQRWAAQQPGDRDEKAVSYLMREIAEMIRNDGVGLSYITQAPQAVDKRQLNLTECLFIHQVNGKHERHAVKEWAVDKGEDLGDVDLVSLEIGEAIVWSPRWLKIREKVRIRLKRTFYAGSTLKFGEKVANVAPPLPEKALEDLRSALSEAAKTAEANDPKALARQVVELRAELAKKHAPATAKVEVQKIEVPVLRDDQILRLEQAAKKVERIAQEAASAAVEANLASKDLRDLAVALIDVVVKARQPKLPFPPPAAAPVIVPYQGRQAPVVVPANGYTIKGKMRDILAALKVWHPKPLPPRRLALWVSMSVESGTWSDYLSLLRTQDLVHADAHRGISLSPAGLQVTKDVPAIAPSTEQLVASWLPKLKGKSKAMLTELVKVYPRGLAPEDLAASDGVLMSTASGTWSDYLSILNTAGLIRKDAGLLYASDDLFPTT